ncbi:MAG: hypothetical protein MI975_26940 [Cytophagales bacterium]|nr:hypothetical protein [Cytophagales bacterium]
MHDELEILEELVKNNLTAFKPNVILEKEAYEKIKEVISNETDRIKKAFVKKAFSWKKEKQVEFYIQYHQEVVVNLIDHVLEHIGPKAIGSIYKISELKNRLNLCKIIYQSLEHLLNYIERHFSKYFNQDAKSPESYRYIVHRDIKQKVPDIRYKLESKQADKRLLSIAFSPLDDFVEGVHRKEVSYRKLIYLKKLLNELTDHARSDLENDKLDLQLCIALCYLNFNTNKFYRFCTKEITRNIHEQESLSEQIEKLAYFLKLNNQIQVKPGFSWHPKARSFQEQLSEWISEELYYLEKRKQLFSTSNSIEVQKDFKFKTDLSVPQLAFYLKLMMETGVIKNKNALEVIRFTSGIVQTKHTENVSWGSLRTKYYQPERHAVEVIKGVVIEFLNQIRKGRY